MHKLLEKKYIFLVASFIVIFMIYLYFRLLFSIPDRSLLSSPPFGEPGWHGIVPGKTTTEEALQSLKRSLYVVKASIASNKTEYPDGTVLESVWWHNSLLGIIPFWFKERNEMVAINGIVRRIEIQIDDTVYARDVISHFGAPEKVARRVDRDLRGIQTGIYLLYPSHGMAFRCVGLYSIDEGLFVPDSPVTHAYYFQVPPLEEVVGIFPPIWCVNHPEEMQDWSGYDPVPW